MAQLSLSDARILAVDDDEANLRVLRRLLQRAGCTQVRTTSDPTSVPDLAEEFDPHLVLLDLHMPVMDGFEILRRLGPHPRQRPRVVVLSGESANDASRRALEEGALAFVSKPFDAEALLDLLQGALEAEHACDGAPYCVDAG